MPPFLATHYTTSAAITQKIHALAERTEPQPRDIFDLNLLFARPESTQLALTTLQSPGSQRRSSTEHGAKLGSAEKALFDFAYLSAGRSRIFTSLPELELPRGFRRKELAGWVARIRSERSRTITQCKLDQFLARA